MASRRRRRTDSDNSDPVVSEVYRSRGFKSSADDEESGVTPINMSFENPTSFRDRSTEFTLIVRSMLQCRKGKDTGLPLSSPVSSQKRRNDFAFLAKKISRDLACVYSKLEKLVLLAKSKSIFDDKEAEINHLTSLIRDDLGLLNQQISQLQQLSKVQRSVTSNDKQSHANSVLVTLQSKLATMTKDFQSVLNVCTETLQQRHNRRREFSSSSSNVLSSSFSSSSNGMKWLLLDDATNKDVSIDMNNVQDNEQLMQRVQYSEDKFLQSRADVMKNIEQTIVELGSIYQQLASMVQEQGDMVERIDSNVEESQMNVELANNEIVRYFQSVSSDRWLMIKIFAVLIFFFIFFIIFFA